MCFFALNAMPRTYFQLFLDLAQLLYIRELVQMSKDTHDLGKAMHLQKIQKLKGLHFKPVVAVHQEQDQVGKFGGVDLRPTDG